MSDSFNGGRDQWEHGSSGELDNPPLVSPFSSPSSTTLSRTKPLRVSPSRLERSSAKIFVKLPEDKGRHDPRDPKSDNRDYPSRLNLHFNGGDPFPRCGARQGSPTPLLACLPMFEP
ncbi:hypothetical protein PIB30_100240 [Stylosanthes scabra]|uniref:Uncharacterized protein n=1 Tax=Stylosanthes scabra TaxID=79078 RepID=A0ABU6XXA6_9FABA|nr:hypothetical protein [Stylosanthes scabra]